MDGFKSPDEIIRQAFALAYFILGDEAEALSVVREALSKLEVAAAAQVKRLYYSPTRRSLWHRASHANSRTKVSLNDTHLLQRLVYVESEPYERERERRPHALRDEDLLVHFVKHLIRISIKRNSFYVALGVSRLLHNYSTNETMEIYNVVVQDPERVKDDYYYRSRKGRLLQEVKERFAEFVSVRRGSRGEERLQTADAPAEFAPLVAECLKQFSPWRTPCSIPRRYDPTTDEIPTLSSAHHGEEDRVEINRIHAVVHPDCYELLTTSLKLEPPALRLSVPRFNLPNGKNDMSRPNDKPRSPAPPLDGGEVEALRRLLSEQSARRRATPAVLLSVVVDKVERARLDPETSGSVSFAVGGRDELVEVRALEGDGWTLLATHLLGGEPGGGARPSKSEIILEGGQRLTFRLSPARAAANEDAQALMSVSYRETEWLRAAALSWRRVARRVAARDGLKGRPAAALIKPAFAALLFILCAGAVALYFFRNTSGPNGAQLASNKEQPAAARPASNAATTSANESAADGANDSQANASSQSNASKPSETVPGKSSETVAGKPSEAVAGSETPTPGVTEGTVAQNLSRSAATLSATPTRAANPTRATQANASTDASAGTTAATTASTGTRRPAPEQAQVATGRASSETEDNSGTAASPSDTDATRSVASNVGATALARVRKVFVEVTGEGRLSEQTARLLASSLREGGRLTPTDVKDDADAALKIKLSERSPTGASQGEKASPGSDPAERAVTVSARLVNEGGEVIWPASVGDRGGVYNGKVYSGKVKDVARRIAADLLRDVRKSDAQK